MIWEDLFVLDTFKIFSVYILLVLKVLGGSVEGGVKDTKGVESTKVGGILREICTVEISWHSRLSLASKRVSSTFLLRFLSILITEL